VIVDFVIVDFVIVDFVMVERQVPIWFLNRQSKNQ